MKQIFFLLLMALGVNAVSAQTNHNALVFEMKDGSSVTYLFDELPRLSFTAEDIVVTTCLYETSYPQQAVQRYVFTYKDPVAVNSPSVEGFRQQGDVVSVGSLAVGTSVNVYSTDGKLMQSANANANGMVTLSLTSLPAGVYLVSYSNTTVKITKP